MAQLRVTAFSQKQIELLSWWLPKGNDSSGIIADGGIRAGKTFAMSISFLLWAMSFDGAAFALCGKTIGALKRNVLSWLIPLMELRGYAFDTHIMENRLVVSAHGRRNEFYIFGGRDEASADLIQGMTLTGVLFDEVALMPESFVNQAVARCSQDGSKLWFNCNPQGPNHWFKKRWIDRRERKRLIYAHLTMADNLSLSADIRARYDSIYSGVFYQRYVLGQWAAADGAIYPMFNISKHVVEPSNIPRGKIHWLSCDYGHTHATVFLLGLAGDDGALYITNERYGANAQGHEMSPLRYSDAMLAFYEAARPDGHYAGCFVDPAAKGFINQLRERGLLSVRAADNAVLPGIQLVSSMLEAGKLKISAACPRLIAEMHTYAWNTAAREDGKDAPIKRDDDAVDALRYLVMADKRLWERQCGISAAYIN